MSDLIVKFDGKSVNNNCCSVCGKINDNKSKMIKKYFSIKKQILKCYFYEYKKCQTCLKIYNKALKRKERSLKNPIII